MQFTRAVNDAALVYEEVVEVVTMLKGLKKAASPYGSQGGSLEVLAKRYRRLDELAKQLAKTNRKANGYGDWLRSEHVLRELAIFSEAMGSNPADVLSVEGMRGYARLAQSMCIRETAGGTEVVHTTGIQALRNYLAREPDYGVLPPKASISHAEADSLLKLFDEGTDFVLEADGQTWVYKGRLRYGPIVRPNGQLFREQHRIPHILHHTIDHARNGPHGVFTIRKDEVFELLHQLRLQGAPEGKDFKHSFSYFVGKADNNPTGSPSRIPYQMTKTARLGMRSPGSDDVATAFPENQ